MAFDRLRTATTIDREDCVRARAAAGAADGDSVRPETGVAAPDPPAPRIRVAQRQIR